MVYWWKIYIWVLLNSFNLVSSSTDSGCFLLAVAGGTWYSCQVSCYWHQLVSGLLNVDWIGSHSCPVALSLILIIMLCIPGITLWSTISINLAIPYWAISIALNVIITACIATKLLYMRYQMRQISVGSGSEYISITSMMIESAAIYTANGLIFLVSYAVNSPIQNLALPVLGQTQVCMLIINPTNIAKSTPKVYRSPAYHIACTPRACLVIRLSRKNTDRNWTAI